jgi:tryptophanyl-tRNA synthetase
MKAKTDTGPTEKGMPKPDYIQNLFLLMQLVSDYNVVAKYESDYEQCTIRYGDMKKQLAEDMAAFISPMREKAAAIQRDKSFLSKIIKQGKDKARESAAKTIKLVREALEFEFED